MSEDRKQPGGTEPLRFPGSGGDDPIADDLDRSLDPNSVTAARLTAGIWLAVLATMSLVASVIVLFVTPLGTIGKLGVLAGWLVGIIALAAWGFSWPAVRYRYASYRVNRNGIQIRGGVIWRSIVSVPKSRVQHTDVSQGPLERGFGLATLVIHTAGTEHAAVSLGGLPHTAALRIRDYLIGGTTGGAGDAV